MPRTFNRSRYKMQPQTGVKETRVRLYVTPIPFDLILGEREFLVPAPLFLASVVTHSSNEGVVKVNISTKKPGMDNPEVQTMYVQPGVNTLQLNMVLAQGSMISVSLEEPGASSRIHIAGMLRVNPDSVLVKEDKE